MHTYPSLGHMVLLLFFVYDFSATSKLTKIASLAFGRIKIEKICFPVQSSTGFTIAGVGRSTESNASPIMDTHCPTIARSMNTSFPVIKYELVMKSCVAATRISPFFGVHKLLCTAMSSTASARASSVCGQWMFISSPSKSALYGVHTHSLKRSVRHGMTRARCAMMDILCSDGWRLNSRTSPSFRCLSTTSPYASSDATRRRSPYFRYCVPPDLNRTKFAPGCWFMPFRTHSLIFSMLCRDTTSG
mmetsp:Transcript_9760/g.36204  ORF Transcript_9760/g.36204 Transcript_9760/m.36204 type:complete len:246 (+) Transcript_9760:3709-4446(+)